MSNEGYKPIPIYDWKGLIVNAVDSFFKETGLTEIQVNAWYICDTSEPVYVERGTLIQDADRYFIQSGGQYSFDSIRVWVSRSNTILEPALYQLAQDLYPESDEVHVTKFDYSSGISSTSECT